VIRKGQAAMEYLMTYGWALLIIIVVMAIFVGLIMNLQAPERCDFSSQGLICNNPMPVISGSNLNFRLGNGFQQKITVTGLACVDDVSAVADDVDSGDWQTVSDGDISQGGYKQFNVSCKDLSGNDAASSLKVGETFKGKLFIKYKFANDVVTDRIADATIVVKKVA